MKQYVPGVKGHARYVRGEKPRGTKMRAVRIPDELWHPLEEIAAQNGMTTSDMLRRLVAERVGKEAQPVSSGMGSCALSGIFKEIDRDLRRRGAQSLLG